MVQTITDWKSRLEQAVLRAQAPVVGAKRIVHVQHALVVTTALNAFGEDSRALFFIESLPPTGNIPRPDLILLHPEVGVLVIENKGVRLKDIHAVDNTSLKLVRDGHLKDEDPFHQAENVMFRLRDLARQRVDVAEALFLRTAALPLIERAEFERQFGVRWPEEALFADACHDAQTFRKQVIALSDRDQRIAHRTSRLSRRAFVVLGAVLRGNSIFYSPRQTYIEGGDATQLGVQIQELELALKEPTQQQKDLGRSDLRGNHRLFRGVTGSGKSVMLALSVSQSLLKFHSEAGGLFAANSPKKRILVVCFNRTLVHYLRQKIVTHYGRMAWDSPDNEALAVTHFEGLVRQLEAASASLKTGLTFKNKADRARAMSAAFDAMDEPSRDQLRWDAVYLDEAQDLDPAEIELLRRLARPDRDGGQTFIVFYDNAQNIYGVSPPVWQQLGVDIVGRTVFLDQCLRNTKETLSLAFNVLVGSFAPEGERVTTRSFADVASLRQRGLVTENGDRLEILFSPRSGPPPRVKAYAKRREEIDGTAAEIARLVQTERVLPSDILILYKSHWSFRDELLEKLKSAVAPSGRIRAVDTAHESNKLYPLCGANPSGYGLNAHFCRARGHLHADGGPLTVASVGHAEGKDLPASA